MSVIPHPAGLFSLALLERASIGNTFEGRVSIMFSRIVSIVALSVSFLLLLASVSPEAASAQTAASPPQQTPQHQTVNLRVLTANIGGSAYVIGFALTELLRKYHPWLRGEAMESRGAEANLAALASDPARRKDTLINANEVSNVCAREAIEPFKAPYKGARAVALTTNIHQGFITLDRGIKSKSDLVGKRVMTMRPGTAAPRFYEILLKDVWGMGDKIKISYGDFEAMKNAIQDGLVDVTCPPISGFPGSHWEPSPALTELMTIKPVYFVGIPPEDVRAIAAKSQLPVIPSTVPPGAIGPKQPEAVQCFSYSLSWWADEQMDEEIVYEITRIMYENAEKFEEYSGSLGKFITKKTLGMINAPAELFHRGALKFYREKGVKVGVDLGPTGSL
jgi:uncharacterized protein